MPLIQLTQSSYRAKFTVSNQENGSSDRDQFAYISHQSQLFPGAAIAFDVFDPGPGNGDGPFAISQTHDQQLMPETNLGAVHNQMDFTQIPELSFQPHPSDGFVPFSYSNSGVIQQPAQSPGRTHQLGQTWDLACNPAQTDRAALVEANDQPGEVANLGNSLIWTQFLNPLKLRFGNRSYIPGSSQIERSTRSVALVDWSPGGSFSGIWFLPNNQAYCGWNVHRNVISFLRILNGPRARGLFQRLEKCKKICQVIFAHFPARHISIQ